MYIPPRIARLSHTLDWHAEGLDGGTAEAHCTIDDIVFNAFTKAGRADMDSSERVQVVCSPAGWARWVAAVRSWPADQQMIHETVNDTRGFLRAERTATGVRLSCNGRAVDCDVTMWAQITAALSTGALPGEAADDEISARGTLAQQLQRNRTGDVRRP